MPSKLRSPRSLVTLAAIAGTAACGGAQREAEPRFSDDILAELEQIVDDTVAELGLPGAMAGLWVEGVGTFEYATGLSDVEAGTPLTLDQHFRIGSITKTFTGTLVLQLADEGKLSLDDTVEKYFPGEVDKGGAITVRNLLNMTSGLANYTFDPEFQEALFSNTSKKWKPEELVKIGWDNTAAGCPHAAHYCFTPGEGWAYSNTNTVMLGLIVEQVTGRSYADELRDRILDPLGLEHTMPGKAALPEPFAHGYTLQGAPEGSDELLESTDWDPSWGFAVGDLVSRVHDLRVYGRALGQGTLLSAEMHAERLTRPTMPPNSDERAYMLGIGFTHGWLGHGGELPGYNAVVYHRPDADATLVVFVNRDQVEYKGTVKEPAYLIADRIIALAQREAPLGDFAPSPDEGGAFAND